MSSLANKYSNWQIYGFLGLFLTNTIWTFYVLFLAKMIPFEKDVVGYLREMVQIFEIHIGIPLVVSFLIAYRMYGHKMMNNSNYFTLLLFGFSVSLIFVVFDHFL